MSKFQFNNNNNGNDQTIQTQNGEANYSGPHSGSVTNNNYAQPRKITPAAGFIIQYVNANDHETTIDAAAQIVFAGINEFSSEPFKQSITSGFQSLPSKSMKINYLSNAVNGLLRYRKNRNVNYPDTKGVFSTFKKNVKISLKSLKRAKKKATITNKENSQRPPISHPTFNPNTFDKDDAKHTQKDDTKTGTISSFKDFMFNEELIKAIDDMAGFEHPSDVQQRAIPIAISGQDIIVNAKPGTGKTTTFILATLQTIEEGAFIDTLVLVACSEMAPQIFNAFERFSKYMDIQIGCVCGGVPFSENKRVVTEERAQILIGTPGTVCCLLQSESGLLQLGKLRRFVIYECDIFNQIDRRKQVEYIFNRTPHNKQVMIFSGSISESNKSMFRKFTKNAQEICVDGTPLTLHGWNTINFQQHFVKLLEKEKDKKVNALLDAFDFNQVVIFVDTKARGKELNRLLRQRAFPSICVHSDMGERERLRILGEFKQYKYRILVNVNVNDIDIFRVNIVINYDMPQDIDEYLRRMNRFSIRTKGLVITFVCSADEADTLSKVKVTPLPNQIPSSVYM